MKIGYCTTVSNIETAESMGFDYIEPSVSIIAQMDDQTFEESCGIADKSPIKCEIFNVLFPKGIALTGQNVCVEEIEKYLKNGFARIKRLGARIVVFGSGGARRFPDEWGHKKANKQLVEITRVIGDIAGMFDITIAVEPLNRNETNIINSVEEGIEFVNMVNHSRIMLLADFYHMRREEESMDVLLEAAPLIKHIHIANSNGRTFPLDYCEDIYEEFFMKLKAIHYNERISIEAKTQDFMSDGPKALELLRNLAV